MTVWIDGVADPDGSVSVLDQTFLRGDGCFEAIRSYGGRPFDLAGHLDRLDRSAAALEMALADRSDLRRWTETAAAEIGDGVIRVVATRGAPRHSGVTVVVAEPLPERPDAYRLAVVEAPWHPAGRPWELEGVKSVSYAPNMAAGRRAKAAGADDALLVSEGVVLEGPTFSVGWVVDGVLETPALDLGILASVTRRHVLGIAGELGIPVRESRWPIDRLLGADETMVYSTIKEVAPVVAVDGTRFEPGPVTSRLSKEFSARVSR